MNRRFASVGLLSLFGLALCSLIARAQDEEPRQVRVLAPNVLKVVPPLVEESETFTEARPLYDLQTQPFNPRTAPITDTLHELASGVILRHDVWCFEFAFKPLRMIELEVPQPTGRMQKKVIWYLMYRVRNLGDAATLGAQEVQDASGNTTFNIVNKPVPSPETLGGRFFPSFVLEGWTEEVTVEENEVLNEINSEYVKKAYLDRVIPSIVDAIQVVEDPALTLHNSVEISEMEIPVSSADESYGVWGVAIWEDIDPRLDYVSVYVQGLTNAFRVRRLADGTDEYDFRTLQLNFWRPGDTIDETNDRIRYGIPVVEALDEQVAIVERYELPGPVVKVTRFDANNDLSQHLFTVDGDIDEEYDSRARQQLSGGQLPRTIVDGLARLGIDVPGNVPLTETIQNREWTFRVDVDGEEYNVRVEFQPLFWEKVGKSLHFTDRLEHLWTYR